MKRILLILLAVLMLVPTLAACNGGGKGGAGTTAPIETQPPVVEYALPEADLNNDEYVFMTVWGKIWQFESYQSNLDILNVDLMKRNKAVEEKYNCVVKLEYKDERNGFLEAINTEMLTQDGAYDVVMVPNGWGTGIGGYFVDLVAQNNVALDQPWFCQQWNDVASIRGRLNHAAGYGSVEFMSNTSCTFFNTELFAKVANGENIFDVVDNGDWTLEKMLQWNTDIKNDVNEDGMDEETDTYGVIVDGDSGRHLMQNWGGRMILKNPGQDPEPDFYYSQNILNFEAMYNLVNKTEGVIHKLTYDKSAEFFCQNRALFMLSSFTNSKMLRLGGMSDYGVIPNPKFDKAQPDYIATNAGCTGFSILRTAQNLEVSGMLLNAYNYYSYTIVRPTYFDTVLKHRMAQDPDSSRMVDVIMNSLYIDFGVIYHDYLAGIPCAYYTYLIKHQKEGQYVSHYEMNTPDLERLLDELVENYAKDPEQE